MPTLTRTQLEHARQRVAQTAAERLTAFKEKLGKAPHCADFTTEEKKALILSGKAKLIDINYYGYAYNNYTYPQTAEMKKANVAHKEWTKKVQAEQARLNKIQASVIDELVMSPDGMDALARIAKAFA